jgi:hypothetical protein
MDSLIACSPEATTKLVEELEIKENIKACSLPD